jgi:predicted nucleic acid-binding Zn ribbon protein
MVERYHYKGDKMPVYEFVCEKCGWYWKHFYKKLPEKVPCGPYPYKPKCDGVRKVKK